MGIGPGQSVAWVSLDSGDCYPFPSGSRRIGGLADEALRASVVHERDGILRQLEPSGS